MIVISLCLCYYSSMKKGEKISDELRLKLSLAKKGKKFSEEHRKNLSLSHKGKIPSNIEILKTCNIGRKLSKETIEKIRQSNLGKKHIISKEGLKKMRVKNYDVWNKGTFKTYKIICGTCSIEVDTTQKNKKYCSEDCYHKSTKREKSYRWIKDRTKVKLDTDRGGPLHKQWSKDVKSRDMWKCKVNDETCSKVIQAHHILSWKDSVDLRYEISNGITLCSIHHPRKREDEKRLSDYFKSLIS